jgi:hypothetical protein
MVKACAIFEKSSVCEKTQIQLQSGEPIGQSDPAKVCHEPFAVFILDRIHLNSIRVWAKLSRNSRT